MDSAASLQFILDPGNVIFLYPLVIMLTIAALEIGTLLIGLPLSGFLENLMPDLDLEPELEVDADFDLPDLPLHLAFLSWLNVGRVPVLILLILFLTVFGLTGYLLQYLFLRFAGLTLPASLVALGDAAFTLYVVHGTGGFLEKVIPKEETTAVSVESLVGRLAEITIGTATKDRPAEARVTDEHGNHHYVMVIPFGDESFTKNDRLVITEKQGEHFIVDRVELP